MKKIYLLLLAVWMLTACEKNKVKNDDELPTIEVMEPTLNSEIRKDTTMRVSALILDNHSIISYSMKIGDESGNTISGFDYSFSEVISDGDENITDFIYGDNLEIEDTLSIAEFYLHFTATDENGNIGTLKHKLRLKQ